MPNEQFIKQVRQTGSSLSVSIPTDIVKLLKIKKGEIVRITIEKANE